MRQGWESSPRAGLGTGCCWPPEANGTIGGQQTIQSIDLGLCSSRQPHTTRAKRATGLGSEPHNAVIPLPWNAIPGNGAPASADPIGFAQFEESGEPLRSGAAQCALLCGLSHGPFRPYLSPPVIQKSIRACFLNNLSVLWTWVT